MTKRPDEILAFFAHQIQAELGIVYAEHNYFQLENRLEEIARSMGVGGLPQLHEHAQKGIQGQFRQLLMDSATNNETSFFRDPKIFTAIGQVLLPWFASTRQHDEKLRVWSAASSSGQEALSVAMTVEEWNERSALKIPYEISATDISDRILQKARAARYTALEVQRGLTPPLLAKYFRRDMDGTSVALPALRERVDYRSLNLKDPFPFREQFHLVLCRNVLIYQAIAGKKDILARIAAILRPEGFLILGAGESLIGLSEDYVQLPSDGAVLYRRKKEAARAA